MGQGTVLRDKGRCSGCGAWYAPDEDKCSYCGTLPSVPPDSATLRAARFRRVRESPSSESELVRASRKRWNGVIGGTIVAAIGGVLVFLAARYGRVVPHLPAAFVVFGLSLAIKSAWRVVHDRQRTSMFPALVAHKRSDMEPGKVTRRVRLVHYVTLELESGVRAEYEAGGSTFGAVAEDDIGVASVLDTQLTGFRRIDV